MSLPGASAPPHTRRQTPSTASNSGVLPADVLFDVLLRLPAKELCRLPAVCRSWRSLTVDPLFTSAHAVRHPDPLFLANFRDDRTHIHGVDLCSGTVVKRVASTDGHDLLCTRHDLACVATRDNSCHVLNPATGAAYVLPQSAAPEHAHRENSRGPYTIFASGQVESTGECKVLRVFNKFDFFDHQQIFVEASKAAVVGGVVYFLTDCPYYLRPDCIASFDLGTEEWRRDIQGPITSSLSMDDDDDAAEYSSIWHKLTFSELKGSLVGAYHQRHQSLDLWLLTDFENCLWVKEYSIKTELAILADEYFVKPLLVLDDGRLVIFIGSKGLLLIYDPRTNTFAQVEMRRLDAVGVYTGNLLSLQGGVIV